MAKPGVAFASEEQARENINRKLRRLGDLLKQGAIPADAPKSLNQFNAWKYAGRSAEESFVSNAHATLTRHQDLKAAAAHLTSLAKSGVRPTLPAREQSVRRAREQTAVHLRLRQIAERHALQVMSENRELRRQIEAFKSQIDSMVQELATIRNAYEEELQRVRALNAELARAAAEEKIGSLRKDV